MTTETRSLRGGAEVTENQGLVPGKARREAAKERKVARTCTATLPTGETFATPGTIVNNAAATTAEGPTVATFALALILRTCAREVRKRRRRGKTPLEASIIPWAPSPPGQS